MTVSCPFSDPCPAYRGLLGDIDALQQEIARLRVVIHSAFDSLDDDPYAAYLILKHGDTPV